MLDKLNTHLRLSLGAFPYFLLLHFLHLYELR
jgi:hypothetical protein